MNDRLWHISNNFLKVAPPDVLKAILEDDRKNYQRAESELGEEIKLLDSAITLYIEVLQGGYHSLDKWKDDITVKAAVVMANSTLNLLFLGRHSILLGYYAEALHLLRGCHERITRCYLFWVDESEARKFFSGQRITQAHVDKKLAVILTEVDDKKRTILEILRGSYDSQSETVHPNLESLRSRTGGSDPEAFSERVVKYPLFGGLLSYNLGKPALHTVIQTALFALSVIKLIFVETSGRWDNEYARISEMHKRYLSQVRTTQS